MITDRVSLGIINAVGLLAFIISVCLVLKGLFAPFEPTPFHGIVWAVGAMWAMANIIIRSV